MKSVVSKATPQSLCVERLRTNPPSLHSIFVVPWFALQSKTYGESMSRSVLESTTQHENWGHMVRVFKSNGSGFLTHAAGDACRKHFVFHAKKLAWMLWTTLVDTYHSNEDFATMDAEDGRACSTQVEFARETLHEEDNVRSEISTPPAILLHHTQCTKKFVDMPTKGQVKQAKLPDISGAGETPNFGVVHDESSAPYLSVRAGATPESTRTCQFPSRDDHCFQFQ